MRSGDPEGMDVREPRDPARHLRTAYPALRSICTISRSRSAAPHASRSPVRRSSSEARNRSDMVRAALRPSALRIRRRQQPNSRHTPAGWHARYSILPRLQESIAETGMSPGSALGCFGRHTAPSCRDRPSPPSSPRCTGSAEERQGRPDYPVQRAPYPYKYSIPRTGCSQTA